MQSQKAEEDRLLRVPMPTFPPTAMVFSVDSRHNANGNAMNGNNSGEMKDIVPMSLIAKVLAQGPPKHQPLRTYLCVNCRKDTAVCDKNTQANLLIDQSIVVERVPANCLHHGMAAKLYRTSSLENGS